MKYRPSEHAIDVLTCLSIQGIGNAWVFKNLLHPKALTEILTSLNRAQKTGAEISSSDFLRMRESLVAELEAEAPNCDGLTVIGEHSFPAIRGNVPAGDYPVALFYRGELELLSGDNPCVAVVGLLNPDEDILRDEQRIVREFTRKGVTIISGLAMGCDSAAHRTALEVGGTTVAILPSTLSKILPSENSLLAEKIVAGGGLLVSEYWREPSSKFDQTGRYIRRDRLQALFSDLIVLAASYSENSLGNDSGSRHAMFAAEKYGIQRAGLPDRSQADGNPKYDLNRQLADTDSEFKYLDPTIVQALEISGPGRGKEPAFFAEPLFS